MGMTIDEALEVVKHEKPERPTSMYGIMKKNAFNTAIDTICKYQKIEQIYKKWNIDFGEQDNLTLLKIGGVLNGNNT